MTKTKFEVGDIVTSSYRPSGVLPETQFRILEVRVDSVIMYSNTILTGWNGKEQYDLETSTGCWNTPIEKLTLISKQQKDELSDKNLEGKPRGIQTTIYNQTIQIASGIRPTGSRATNFRVREQARTSTLQYNLVLTN